MIPTKLADRAVSSCQYILLGGRAVEGRLCYHDPPVLTQNKPVAESHQCFESFRDHGIADAMVDAQVVARFLFVDPKDRS